MNVTTKRLGALVTTIVLLALTAALSRPAPSAEGKSFDFAINTHLGGLYAYVDYTGTFTARGIVKDSGFARCDFRELVLEGESGTIVIELSITEWGDTRTSGTFQIVAADGAYADLVGVGGTYWDEFKYGHEHKVEYPEGPYCKLRHRLRGFVP